MGFNQRKCRFVNLAIALGLGSVLAGCQGSAIIFEWGASAQVRVDENTTASVWIAVAKVEGVSNPSAISYRLIGPDAERFKINTNGELFFKQSPDFEQPQDADKNNEYRVDIEASANSTSAVQTVRISVADVKTPQVALVQPKLYENVGKGDELEVATVVRVFDAESNTPLQSLEVKQNSLTLQRDTADASLWKGTMVVPEGGVDFPLSAVLADGTELNANAKLFNKRNSLSPKFLGVSPGSYLILLDPQRQSIRKLRLSDLVWYDYLTTPRLNTLQNLEFNSTWEFIYSSFKSQADDTLFALRVSQASPGFYYPGCLPGSVANIVYDNTNKRTLVVLARQEQDIRRFKVLSFAADQNTGFVDAQQSFSDPPCIPAPQNVVWDIPAGVIQGTFKDFNYHRLGKSFVVADERIVNGAATTAIQVFSDNGDKRFEVQLGADVSNMAINNDAGVIYVAEQHSSAAGKIKAIDINTGLVTDLVQSISGNSPGSYTQLRVDNPNKKLYIADDVSDAFFVVDLTTNNMSELIYQAASIR